MGFCPEFENLEIMCEDASIDDKAFEDYFTKHLGYSHSKMYGSGGLVEKYHPIRSSSYWLDYECEGFDEDYPMVSLEKWKKRMCIRTDLAQSSTAVQQLQPSLMSESLHRVVDSATPKPITTMFCTREQNVEMVRKILKGRSIEDINIKDLRKQCDEMNDIDENVRRTLTSREMSPPIDIMNWIRCYS